jgi:hypothetical protein
MARVQLTGMVDRKGRGSLSGKLVVAADWDSDEVNDAIASDFGMTPRPGAFRSVTHWLRWASSVPRSMSMDRACGNRRRSRSRIANP